MPQETLSLFDEPPKKAPDRLGRAVISAREGAQVLSATRGKGFLDAYDYALNPYIGCSFACAYCYAVAFMPEDKRDTWGAWVEYKAGAEESLRKKRDLQGKRLYMSSVTDPYQPLEGKLELTRRLVEILSEPERQPRLVVQTRAPLVTRDIDLFQRFTHLRVNMTVTTDDESVRKRFEPGCPSNAQRMEAIRACKAAGLKIGLCITPMLPLSDPEAFGKMLASLEADVYVAQAFHAGNGAFSASTREMARAIAEEYGYTDSEYRRAFTILRKHLPHLYEGKAGFFPE